MQFSTLSHLYTEGWQRSLGKITDWPTIWMLARVIYSQLWRVIWARGLNTRFSQVDPTKVKACKMMSKEMIIIWGHSRGPPDHKGKQKQPVAPYSSFLSRFQHIFSWFQTWNHWKRFKIKNFKNGSKKYFNQLSGARSTQKLVEIHNSCLLSLTALCGNFFLFFSFFSLCC